MNNRDDHLYYEDNLITVKARSSVSLF